MKSLSQRETQLISGGNPYIFAACVVAGSSHYDLDETVLSSAILGGAFSFYTTLFDGENFIISLFSGMTGAAFSSLACIVGYAIGEELSAQQSKFN